jgi:hypothetical protein
MEHDEKMEQDGEEVGSKGEKNGQRMDTATFI